MATIIYPSLTKSQSMRSKRKSAVELLAESKPFYVKSEFVRDNTQQLPLRTQHHVQFYGNYNRSKSVSVPTTANSATFQANIYNKPANFSQFITVSPSRSLPPQTHRRSVNVTTIAGHNHYHHHHHHQQQQQPSNDLLQNKLRQLLVCDTTDELRVDQMAPLSPPAEYSSQRCHKSLPDLHCRSGNAGSAEPSSNKSSNKSLSNRDSGGSSGHYTQRSEPAPPIRQFCSPEARRDSGSSTQHSGGSSYYCCQEPDCRTYRQQPQTMSSYQHPQPQSQTQQPQIHQSAAAVSASIFKRQKCLRYKRDRPILRSKSDISDRYWRPPELPTSHLEQFFEHLGLTLDSYESIMNAGSSPSSSPIFFSDVSTVDSSRPLDNNDVFQPQSYRNSDPPSIVERNARIIKWLCNCRKAQLA